MANRQIRDFRGNVFHPVERPTRVVCLVPSITELLFDFGLSTDEIVGRTRFCIHPKDKVKQVPSMGGTKDFKIDRVISQQPAIIIANVDENKREDIDALEREYPQDNVFVTHPNSFEDAIQMIYDLGALFKADSKARAMIDELFSLRQQLRATPKGSVLYLIWKEPYMTVSPGTFIHDMLEQTGHTNCITATFSELRYPEVSTNDIIRLQPDTIYLSSEPYPFKQQHIDEIYNSIALTDPEYAKHVNIKLVDGEYYSWYGSRMLKAMRECIK